jgi:hypothetical protein
MKDQSYNTYQAPVCQEKDLPRRHAL